MAMACKQHHLLFGLGARQRVLKENLKLSTLPFNYHVQKKRSSSWFKASAGAGSPSPGDASSSNTKSPPSSRVRRGEIPPEWEELSKPVPKPPNYLLLAAGFSLVYLTRQAIAEELVQWASILAALGLTAVRLIHRLLILFSVKMLKLVKVPVAWVLILAGWSGIFARDLYSLIVNTTSIWPTMKALLLVTLVLSIGEAANPKSVSEQPWSFLMASAFGVGAVWRMIHHTVFVLLLLLLTGYSLLVQKKDAVLAALPATAVLVAIAEPPLKAVALILYLAIAIYSHWRTPREKTEMPAENVMVQPLLMVVAALFVGLTAGSRFLTAWQILWLAKG